MHAIAAEPVPGVCGQDDRRLLFAEQPFVDRSVAQKRQRAGGSLEQRLAHGAAGVVGGVVEVAVAVEQGADAVWVIEQDIAGILARDDGVDPAQIGVDGGRVAQKEPKGVDPVDACFVHQESRHLLKIRLPVKIGAWALPVAGAQAEGDLMQGADGVFFQSGPDRAIPGLEPEVFMHDQAGAGLFGEGDHVARFVQALAERFLADERADTRRDRGTDRIGLGYRWQDDIEQVRLRLGQHVGQVVKSGQGGGARLGDVAVAGTDKLHLGHARPTAVMELAEIARADAGDPQGAGSGHARSIATRTACAACTVEAVPPMSGVAVSPLAITASTPSRSRVASAVIVGTSCRNASQSSIIAADRIIASGLAMPWPAMSGAEPWQGWNTA